jgi:hypothetical protein
MLTTLSPATFEIDRNPGRIAASVLDILQSEAEAVKAFSGHSSPGSKSWKNRRRDERKVVRIPITLLPVHYHGGHAARTAEATAVGLARDLSRRGIGLAYDSALKSRHVIVEFDLFGVGELQLLTEFRWCRKRGPHDYLAGGQFLGLVISE